STAEVKLWAMPGKRAVRLVADDSIAGGGWIVVQRRNEHCANPTVRADEYEQGFGEPSGCFWLGLDALHDMTNRAPHELYIHLVNHDGATRYARYDNFVVAGPDERFALKSLGRYYGNAGDAMRCQEGQEFRLFTRQSEVVSGWWLDTELDW
ncbi:hypothetical protein KR222_008385, partial [Zaprionus bogoriensis]